MLIIVYVSTILLYLLLRRILRREKTAQKNYPQAHILQKADAKKQNLVQEVAEKC